MKKRQLLALLFFILFLNIYFSGKTQTTLAQGDITILGYHAVSDVPNPRSISFVVWKQLEIGTVIKFTDNGFNSGSASTASGNYRNSEQTIIWTANAVVPAGTVVKINGSTPSTGTAVVNNANGTANTAIGLTTSNGDQVFAFQSSTTLASNPAATFDGVLLYGMGFSTPGAASQYQGWLSSGSPDSFNSYAPSDLLTTSRHFILNSNAAQYNGPRSGEATLDDYKAMVRDTSRWVKNHGSIISLNTTSFTVAIAPTITSQPDGSTICAGNNTSFTVGASDATGYQWYVNPGTGYVPVSNGGVYSGATSQTLDITGATAGMSGFTYRVEVTGTASPNATSNSVTLTVNSPATITSGPSNSTICSGANTSFSVSANYVSTGYQWYENTGSGFMVLSNGARYSGVTTQTLNITGATAGMNGYQYRVVVSGLCTPSSTTSTAATLTVQSAPVITQNPVSATACAGGTFSMNVTASNASTYQWQVNTGVGYINLSNGIGLGAANYSGVTTGGLSVSSAGTAINGYLFRCVVTGSCTPSATSSGAAITITQPGTWLGTSNTLWSNTANWSCGTLPTATTNVTISSSAPNMPVVDITGAVCNDLTIQSGASVTINNGQVLTIKGSATNNGTFSAVGKTTFSGGNQTLPGGSYENLEIAGTGTKTLDGAVTVSGTFTLTSSSLELGNNDLTIGSSGSLTGGSASSYVITNGSGSLKRQGIGAGAITGLVIFPVGTSLSYTPLAITNAGTPDAFSARVINKVYDAYDANDVPTGTEETQNSVNKTWMIKEDVPGGSSVTLYLQWNAGDEQSGFNRSTATPSHYTAGYWHAGAITAVMGADPYVISMSGITSFSPFGVGSTGSVLPLKLLSFTGKATTTGNTLQWSTSEEVNVASFSVERSANGADFAAIGTVSARNAAGQQQYQFVDNSLTKATSYYRLKMVDKDASFTYSPVVVVSANSNDGGHYLIYPNPVVGSELTIKATSTQQEDVVVSIMDATGRQWQSGNVSAGMLNSGKAKVGVSNLPAGLYLMQLRGAKSGAVSVLKFQKK